MLDVTVNKTSTAFTKAVDPIVGEMVKPLTGAPTIRRPIGKPAAVKPQGTEIALQSKNIRGRRIANAYRTGVRIL